MIKFETEHEIPQLRFAYVNCPSCDERFDALLNGSTEQRGCIRDSIDLQYGVFKCPHCFEMFSTRGEEVKIDEY